MKTVETEFLIIGSGFGAAAPALRLSQAGFNVLMIEKGKYIEPEKDLRQTQDPKYFLEYLKSVSGNNIGFTFAEAYGGGSAFYEMVSLRAPSSVFDLKDKNGRRYWPAGISRKVMDPYYDIAERMLNVEQIPFEKIPKSGVVFSLLMKKLGYTCDRARYAVKECIGSGYCISGCIFGAKQSLHYNYLPQACSNGMKIMCSTEAKYIIPLDNTDKYKYTGDTPFRYIVRCMNLPENESLDIKAKFLILGGGTIGTTKLLLLSKNYLRRLSRHTGRNIAFNGSVKAAGLLSDDFPEGDMFSGMSHPGMISYNFFDSRGITISSAKPLPLVLTSDARITRKGKDSSYWGRDYQELMKLYRKRMIVLYALGLTEPSAGIVHDGNETFSALLDIDKKLRSYHKDTKELLNSIFTKNGCEALDVKEVNSEGEPKDEIYFSTTHMVGSCRMAENIKAGVVDSNGEVFGYPGIYITDGAAVPTSLAVNSALTILANAERISANLVNKLLPGSKSS